MSSVRPAALLLLGLTVTSGSPTETVAQSSVPLISVEAKLADYGITSFGAIRRGRVSIVYAPDGPRLSTYFLRDTPRAPRPPIATPPDPVMAVEGLSGTRRVQRALWVWNSRQILDEPEERGRFLDFVERHAIDRVFLYLPSAPGTAPSAGYIPFDGHEVGPLLAQLGARGAVAYALDGDRDYVLPENHAGVYRTVERLAEHNRRVPPEQRFYGVRYDIEPYLVPGFQGPARQALLNGYVELIAGVAERAEAGDLAVAVDIPFWFDAPDEETGAYLEADLAGERKRVLEHVVTLVDDFAIMDYRTRADGPNGALIHAGEELALAAPEGVGVFVGVETTRLLDEDLHTFFGPPTEGLPPLGTARWFVVEDVESGRVRIWLADGAAALAELGARVDPARAHHWPAGRPARVAADAQSFYALGAEEMRRVTEEITGALRGRPAFLGLAYHDYLGLRALLGGG